MQPDPQRRKRAERHESERKTKSVLREALARASLPANNPSHGCVVGTTGAHQQPTPLTMTSLNSKLQLALLNRKKSGNLIEKGFTLVELMIVIVIVGILSSVALPNFLAQQDKARATEGTQTLSTILKSAYADYQQDLDTTDAQTAANNAISSANKDNFSYSTPVVDTANQTFRYSPRGKWLSQERIAGAACPTGIVKRQRHSTLHSQPRQAFHAHKNSHARLPIDPSYKHKTRRVSRETPLLTSSNKERLKSKRTTRVPFILMKENGQHLHHAINAI